MAVNLRQVFRPPAAVALVLCRAALLAVAALPAWFTAREVLVDDAARRPYFIQGPLDAFGLARLGQTLGPAWYALGASLAVALLLSPLLDAAALRRLDPERPDRRLRRILLREAPSDVLPLLRVTILFGALDTLGIAAIVRGLRPLSDALERSGATALRSVVEFGALRGLLIAALVSVVGAAALLVRSATVTDGRRRVRRTTLLCARALPRLLLALPVYAVVNLSTQVISGAALVLWRQADPYLHGTLLLAAAGFAAALLLQSYAWLCLLGGARLLWTSQRLADLRAQPDGPLGILRARWFFTDEDESSIEPAP